MNEFDHPYKTALLSYRRIYPQLVVANRKLWRKIEMADRAASRIAEALYNGRLELVSVEDEPFIRNMRLLRSYVQARVSLGHLSGSHQEGELEGLVDPSMQTSHQLSVTIEAFRALQLENEHLERVIWIGHWLRTDPLALVLWYQEAGRE